MDVLDDALRQSGLVGMRAIGSGSAGASDYLDVTCEARRSRESCIGGHQNQSEGFGQRGIRSVIGRHRATQRPDTFQQWTMRASPQWQVLKIRYCSVGASSGHQLGRDVTAPDRSDLQIDEFRSCQRLAGQTLTGATPIRAVVAQRHRQDARVNDDHVQPGCHPPPR